jgi:hypothetical protein
VTVAQRNYIWTRGLVIAVLGAGLYRNYEIFYGFPWMLVPLAIAVTFAAYALTKQYQDAGRSN